MRILLVTNYYEPDQGAASVVLTRLTRKLQQRGHDITVLTSLPNYPQGRILDGYRGRLVLRENRDGIRVIQTWLWATPSPRISRKFLSQISFMLTAGLRGLGIPRPDVLLVEAQPIFTSLAGVFLSTLKAAPYVLDVRDLWPDHILSVGAMTADHPAYRAARWTVDSTYRGAAGIIAVTPLLERAIQGYIGPTDKILQVYSGVDLTRFHPGIDASAFRQKYSLGDNKLISYIGTFGTAYDLGTMLKAAERLADRRDVTFLILGTGSQKDLVQERLASGKLPNVRWVEWVDYSEIPQALAATHTTFWALHNHPLHQGAIGTKLYEAMGSGVPVAGALEGVAAQIIRDSGAGLTVPFEDTDGLAAAIRRLVDDAAFHSECSRRARAYAEQHFDAEQAASKYEAALLDAMRRGR